MESNSIIAKFKKLNLSGRRRDRNVVECYDITQPQDAPPQKLTLRAVRAAGRGTFGSVLQAVIEENKETVAVKTVYQDPQYQNRELEIMRKLRHDCIVLLKYYYLSERRNGTYLHLMMEFLPFSLGRVLKYYSRRGEQMPLIYQQLYAYQLLRGVGYLSTLRVVHRDLKPDNCLVEPERGLLKVCDFGTAKMVRSGDTNVSYVCSRPYRAPELVLGKEEYAVEVDWWSTGCVIAEIVLHRPLFCSSRGPSHQIKSMARVLGSPSDEDIDAMGVKRDAAREAQYDRPVEKVANLDETLPEGTNPGLIELASSLLKYAPRQRATPLQAMRASFFEPLHDAEALIKLPNGKNVQLGAIQLGSSEEAELEKIYAKLENQAASSSRR